nr:hypothetical protein CFP56_64123 [Quercus suber]
MIPRALIAKLLTSLSQDPNPLARATSRQRALLLTLHVLFPHDLLPALDLLDRELVARLCVPTAGPQQQQRIYLVRSAAAAGLKRGGVGVQRCYELQRVIFGSYLLLYMIVLATKASLAGVTSAERAADHGTAYFFSRHTH